jgi:outer membrane protein
MPGVSLKRQAAGAGREDGTASVANIGNTACRDNSARCGPSGQRSIATGGDMPRLRCRRPSRASLFVILSGLFLACPLSPAVATAAQDDAPPTGDWTLLTRLFMTGTSEGSDPEGYEVYSAFGLEAGLRRDLGARFALELDVSPQSREVELVDGTEPAPNLGSLEILPLVLLLQWRPMPGGSVRPYVGAGVALSIFWEKSGELNSTDIPADTGVALQLGLDFPLSPRLSGNFDFRWHSLTADIGTAGEPLATLRIHPSSLNLGVGYRF